MLTLDPSTLIRLHSSAAYPPHKSPIFTPSYSAGQQCYSAVENIVALAQYVVRKEILSKLGPPFGFALWVAARVLLVHGSTIETYVSQDIHFLIHTLCEMGRHWPVAARYCTILQRVVEEYQEYQSHRQIEGQASTPSSVRILADMRRCAYEIDILLVSSQSRQSASQPAWRAPARDPMANELDYLETFDFFNYPRIPTPMMAPMGGAIDSSLQEFDIAGQVNINNFSIDANADWLRAHIN